ncbi:MAG: transposase [Nanoarchaeota archaeon]
MKFNPVRYSSAVGEVWIMLTLKVKYCHNVFDIRAVREYTDAVLTEALDYYEIRWEKKSFDSNHVHINLDMGIKSKPEIAKMLKGFTAPKIFKEFPWLRSRLFRKRGFWNSATDGRTGDMHFYDRYLDGQKYGKDNMQSLQQKLAAYT